MRINRNIVECKLEAISVALQLQGIELIETLWNVNLSSYDKSYK